MTHHDEFYIGYDARMPPGVARTVTAAVAIAVIAVSVIAVSVTRAQRPVADSSFEFGVERGWTGWLVLAPAPALLVPSPHGVGRFWLVGRGKHGASAAVAGLGEGWVRVAGTQISRDPWRMIEVTRATRAEAPPGAQPPAVDQDTKGHEITVRGEIVDSKCFLGVMNPGERTVHRDCAIRCISGGVPPMLSYSDQSGRAQLAILVDAGGGLLHDDVHELVGRPVEARGRVAEVNGQPVFQLLAVAGAGR